MIEFEREDVDISSAEDPGRQTLGIADSQASLEL